MDDIYTELSTVMEKGDERAAIDFIIKNIDKFSQKEQDHINTSIFEQEIINY